MLEYHVEETRKEYQNGLLPLDYTRSLDVLYIGRKTTKSPRIQRILFNISMLNELDINLFGYVCMKKVKQRTEQRSCCCGYVCRGGEKTL